MTQHMRSKTPSSRMHAGSAVLSLLVAVGLAMPLLGCEGAIIARDEEARIASTPSERHAIGFQTGRMSLDVEIPPGREGLSFNQQSDVLEFFRAYRAESKGPLGFSISGAHPGRAEAAVRHLRDLALEAGISPASVQVTQHTGSNRSRAHVRLSYSRPQAVPPVCGDWSEDLGRSHERVPYPNFGCATQRNLALNVANARDLQVPAAEDPSSSERRFVNWSKYVGVPVSTPGAAIDTKKSGGGKPGQPAAPKE